MAKKYATPWQRYKFLLNGLVLILPVWFLYQSLSPEFPPALETQTIGEYEISPMPFDLDGPYQHDGEYVKDFLLMFKQGNISNIRQAVLNIGETPLSLSQVQSREGEEGFLHGSRHGQHVHGLAKPTITQQDSVWLTIENWNGDVLTGRWDIPATMLSVN